MTVLRLSATEQQLVAIAMAQLDREKAEAEARAARTLLPVLAAHGVAEGERFRFEPDPTTTSAYRLVVDRPVPAEAVPCG
jgi:hypothetical protein